ncbi:Na+ H+-dicarboxylate symporter [Agrilactobacillus composti DSM 18527 = JCM 14202]|uniref:L-cystine uptake protein TcyP n=1 Tax=Agrilactobacillus composti DSM 18527 = JCM 14202 TaxID=1423734 RepID=X0PP85_9LACO|nr:cation:dicarboxylase symporter family transporter [Agrilactobacillus composti]KRM34925.1 Na+ H+-dicarboxylate symporter [Agrilactobacillus composti DSM 18527 = JCM 14202]GAF38811.1 L-cystine uptake protein TcyP [Agrilactobacillus composti DSM 18527 = JCM 14202]
MNIATTILIVVISALILGGLIWLQQKHVKFTKRVFLALVVGVVFGFVLQLLLGTTNAGLTSGIDWLSIVGDGYVGLLKMLVIPLIFVSLVGAFIKLEDAGNLKKITGSVLGILLVTTAVSALIGIAAVWIFHLQGAKFIDGASASKSGLAVLQEHQTEIKGLTLPKQIVSFIPTNIFADFAGTRPTSTIAVVIFSIFVGVAYLGIRRKEPEQAATFAKGFEAIHSLVSRIVTLVLRLTPYGIFALMTRATATNSIKAIGNLGIFIIAAYVALAVVLIIHTLILIGNGINPVLYYKKAWPALLFAFTSRTSAGTLPLNVKTQIHSLGVPPTIANFAASFGLTIGQNGCAGVYPAMIATIIAPTVGINVFSIQFILTLLLTVTIASFGVAGVGGGATFSTLMVLGVLNLPVSIMAVIIAIDPIVDMARTLVNVNDSIMAGVLTAKYTKELDHEVLQTKDNIVVNA